MDTGDRISELYKGEIFAEETQAIARRRVQWICEHTTGRKVVDMGCSQGIVSILLARQGLEVVGVDGDAGVVQYAESDRAKEPQEVQQRLTFVCADIRDAALPERTFDTAIMGEFLEHLANPDEAIASAYELLADDGLLIVTVPFGLFQDPGHRQTFYVASLYRMISPRFAIAETEIIGKYLCLSCRKRKAVLSGQVDSIGLSLVESAEREFLSREMALTADRDSSNHEVARVRTELNAAETDLDEAKKGVISLAIQLSREKAKVDVVIASVSYRLGSILLEALLKPGRNTVLLPYRLACLARRGIRSRGRDNLNESRKLFDIYEAKGTEAASSYIEQLRVPDTEKATLYEHLLDLVFRFDAQSAGPLLVRSFELDFTYERGKRLAQLGFDKGMVSEPSALLAHVSRMREWGTSSDVQLSNRVWAWGQLRLSPPAIPAPETASPAQRQARTACMMLHCCLPYHSNGYAIRSHGLLSALRNTPWRVSCYTRPGYPWDITCHVPPDESEVRDVEGVIYHHLKGAENRGRIDTYLSQAAAVVESALIRAQPSVVHAASNHVTALPALIAARRLGIPFVYEVRGLWEITAASVDTDQDGTELFDTQRNLEAMVACESDRVITLTAGLREELASRGVRAEKIVIIPNCVDAERFKPVPQDRDLHSRLGLKNAPTIGYVGSFVAYEGLDDLIRAVALLKADGVVFNLLLVGDGRVSEELRDLVKNLGVEKDVFFTGRVPHDDVERYYSLVDIAPFPRKPVPVCEMVSPLKPLEAMAMAKVVLVSSVGGLVDMVQAGRTGLVFEKGDIEDLAARLRQAVEDRAMAEELRRNGLEWVRENRTWEIAAEGITAVYDELS